jgi:hypothetical protein
VENGQTINQRRHVDSHFGPDARRLHRDCRRHSRLTAVSLSGVRPSRTSAAVLAVTATPRPTPTAAPVARPLASPSFTPSTQPFPRGSPDDEPMFLTPSRFEKGMTWGRIAHLDQYKIDLVGCRTGADRAGESENRMCDPYQGDMRCDAELLILCLNPQNLMRPDFRSSVSATGCRRSAIPAGRVDSSSRPGRFAATGWQAPRTRIPIAGKSPARDSAWRNSTTGNTSWAREERIIPTPPGRSRRSCCPAGGIGTPGAYVGGGTRF